MPPLRTLLLVVGGFILFFVAFFLAPVIPFTQSVSIPNAYKSGFTECLATGSSTNLTEALAEQQKCLNGYLYPPASVTRFGTPAYRLVGYGGSPFPSQVLVSQGNYSALVFFKGSQAVAAENAGPGDVVVNPNRVVEIDGALVYESDFGYLNITVTARNIGSHPIQYPTVYLSMSGFSVNTTNAGLTWIQPRPIGTCDASWSTGEYCTVSRVVANGLPTGKPFNFYVEVRGYVEGRYFVYRQGYQEGYPEGGVGPHWVAAFINQVEIARQNVSLSESNRLDTFAAIRFTDAIQNYTISDYNFTADATRFFGPNNTSPYAEEVLLYPGNYGPNAYSDFLSKFAIGHWSALTNPYFTQYGYYVGHAPYYVVSLPCPVYEIPREGINIPEFFQQHGCLTTVADTTWLVIILTP